MVEVNMFTSWDGESSGECLRNPLFTFQKLLEWIMIL